MKGNIDRDILKKYVNNTCSEEERLLVEKWLDPKETWNVEGDQEISDEPKVKIWAAIHDQIGVQQGARTKMIRLTRYAAAAAAAVVILFLTFSRENSFDSAISYDTASVTIQKLGEPSGINGQSGSVEFYQMINRSEGSVVLTTKGNGRRFTLKKDQLYLTVRMDDPGVMGDEIVILTPEQIKMLPDGPLAGQLASIVNQQDKERRTPKML